ncbi:MAG: cell division protein FtsK, partial [Marivirga sp.]|nr:cell division protein FtsK [Marivirga sp.]
MAQNTYKSNTFKKPEKEKKGKASSKTKLSVGFLKDPRFKLAIGFFLMITAVFLLLALLSYLFTGQADQSVVESQGGSVLESGKEAENWLGLYGAITSHYFIFRWFGISAFFIPPLLFIIGFKIVFHRELLRIFSFSILSIFTGLWLSLLLGYMTMINDGVSEWSFLGGGLGYHLAVLSDGLFGWGTFLILILSLFIFIIFYFNVTAIPLFVNDPKPMGNDAIIDEEKEDDGLFSTYIDEKDNWPEQPETKIKDVQKPIEIVRPVKEPLAPVNEVKLEVQKTEPPRKEPKADPLFTVEEPADTDKLADQLVQEQGLYDPTLDLKGFKFPPLDLLNEYDPGRAGVTQEELNQNKDKIVATLVNFKIGIQSIKATIGPTVTLYE